MELRRKAQDVLLQGVANQLGYYDPKDFDERYTPEEEEELRAEMKRQADRIARMFGYEESWSN